MEELNLDYIAARRKELNFSIDTMASALGLANGSSYWKYEHGVYKFNAKVLPILARKLECKIEDFFSKEAFVLNQQDIWSGLSISRILPAVLGSVKKAVFLESLHELIQGNRRLHSKDVWIEKTYEEWHMNLPFFSVRTLKRIVNDLRNRGIVVTKNQHGMDRTLLYRIDYKKLDDTIMKFLESKNM